MSLETGADGVLQLLRRWLGRFGPVAVAALGLRVKPDERWGPGESAVRGRGLRIANAIMLRRTMPGARNNGPAREFVA
ncbi:hypothetical protein [Parenemella sanctibonifatiensis]|uniref:Uncharacterized protein n=1 Tax=Parenemella sanctibonifatiensis TaxID=2016505 RepID=A0A255DYF8_9ACTN|nr:hypothetical protein [Parenemella sanctibonifatiensis]OYN84130.1 hypothetical protein CGZ92_13900 [Parenemella sanctibonifatiensis]